MSQLRIGISGASGFIGRKLMDYFIDQGHDLVLLSRNKQQFKPHPNVRIIETDLSHPDSSLFREILPQLDLFYHLAGELNDPKKMYAANVEATKMIVNELAGSTTRFIYLSSIGIFDLKKSTLIKEDSLTYGGNPYEESKLMAEKIITSAQNQKGLKAVLIRPSIVIGLAMKSTLLLQLIRLTQKGIRLKFTETSIANFVLVNDLIQALILVGQHPKAEGQAYNFSNDVPLKNIINAIEKYLPSKRKIELPVKFFQGVLRCLKWLKLTSISKDGVAFFSNTTHISSEKIKKELGFKFTQGYDAFLEEYVTCRR